MKIELVGKDAINAKQALEALVLTKRKRFWLLKDLGRWEKRMTRSRIRRQKDVDNQKFEKRKRGEGAVLTSFENGMEPYVLHDATMLDLTWRRKTKAKKATVHQAGLTQTVAAREYIKEQKKRRGEPDYDGPCTKEQAIALRRLGYRVRRKDGKGWNKPSVRNLEKRLTLGQAGLIIRMMRTGKPKGKQSWKVHTPQRQMLGTKPQKVKERFVKNIEKARKKK
ncbi:hypothetical protein [Vibrio lentus]|uniref:hypothetical protein n=1 Tax=Vibrio lentus TaxID=136468 RepID=UPI000C84E40C|nr:hypothetical protein [Vibrio lentus]PMI90113.1 hypothetical protein BCU35_21980 [Vibrio lentus]